MQHGPGAENAFGGVAQAYGESVPILVIPAGYPRRIAHVPPNFNSTSPWRTSPSLPSRSPRAPTSPNAMRRAFSRRATAAARPVLVEFPTDVLRRGRARSARPTRRSQPTRSGPDPGGGDAKPPRCSSTPSARSSTPARASTTPRPGTSCKELAELLAIPVTHQPAGQERLPREPSAVARLRRPRHPEAGAPLPRRVPT